MVLALSHWHRENEGESVPVYLCGDISHGVADALGVIQHTHTELFRHEIPYMAEFHFKNTDERFDSTFGFSPEECARGIVDLHEVMRLIDDHADQFPVRHLVGHLELPGPKLGREYSDHLLEGMIRDSVETVKRAVSACIESSAQLLD
jgi:ribulose-phosphate 3-epimerase